MKQRATSSFQRAQRMQAFLVQALAEHGFAPRSILPDDPKAPVHVVELVAQDDDDAIWVIFAVSQFNAFMPMAVTDFAPREVSSTMLASIAQLRRPEQWQTGTIMDVLGAEDLAKQNVSGLVFLHPQTTGVLKALEEETSIEGECYAPRLAVFLKGDEIRDARQDLWGLLDRFQESGRDVFLLYKPATESEQEHG